MTKVVLQNKAKQALDYMKDYEKSDFGRILNLLQELQDTGWNDKRLKPIGDNIKRMRSGRRRVLCSEETKNILVWIIAIEKDTKKDYQRWKKYILKNL